MRSRGTSTKCPACGTRYIPRKRVCANCGRGRGVALSPSDKAKIRQLRGTGGQCTETWMRKELPGASYGTVLSYFAAVRGSVSVLIEARGVAPARLAKPPASRQLCRREARCAIIAGFKGWQHWGCDGCTARTCEPDLKLTDDLKTARKEP